MKSFAFLWGGGAAPVFSDPDFDENKLAYRENRETVLLHNLYINVLIALISVYRNSKHRTLQHRNTKNKSANSGERGQKLVSVISLLSLVFCYIRYSIVTRLSKISVSTFEHMEVFLTSF